MAIKLLDTAARFEIISQYDSSIDGVSEEGNVAWNKYLETLQESALVVKPGAESVTKFVVRCLTASEQAELQTKHMILDPVRKVMDFKYGHTKYLLDLFQVSCLGIKRDDGSLLNVTIEDVGLTHAQSVAMSVITLTTLGKNLKNV